MGCGALRGRKTHPAPDLQTSELCVVPSPSKASRDEPQPYEIDVPAATEEVEDDECDDDDEEDSESEESIPGEPLEAKWARAAKRKKKLARQRRRAAKAAKEGTAISSGAMSVNSFAGIRPARANLEKDGCFDRQCFLVSSRVPVDEIYDLSINLGKGTFGTVERCTHRKTKKMRAIKTIPKKKVYDDDRLAWEVDVMRVLEHPNILKIFESFEDDKNIYIIMELCNGGELLERLMALNGGGFSEKTVAKVMRQVVSAVYYMHQQQICHRDLKPENFLLMDEVEDVGEAQIKVIDFGFARRFEPGGFMSTRACTNNYVAPEVLDGSYTEACDIWSLGVIIYVLLSGQKPFFGASDAEVLAKTKKCDYNFDDPAFAAISEDAKDIIRRTLVLDIGKRLDAKQMLKHCWISQLAPRATVEVLPADVLSRLLSFNVLGKFKKVAMTAVAQQLHEDSIRQLREIFQALDENEDGTLSLQEAERGLRKAGIDMPEDLQRALEQVDSDGSGFIDYTEFLAATLDEKHHLQEAACWSAFRVFDTDGDGKITKDELAVLLSCGRAANLAESLGADRAEIERAVAEADIDGDEKLDFEEFRALLLSSCVRKVATVALPNALAG